MFDNLLNTTFDLYTNAIVSVDTYGGVNRSMVKVGTYPCYVTMLSADELVVYGKTNVISTHRLFCNLVDIKTSDVIYVNNSWFNISYCDYCNFHHLEIYLYQATAPQIITEESTSSESSSYSSSSSES